MQYTDPKVYEYISQQTGDPIVERKICAVSGTQFPIFQSDLDFYSKISPTFAGEKFQILTPTLCPEERQRRRLSFRNERVLYKRKCDATGDWVVSIYSPDKPYKVYNQKFWWSDLRDPMSYGMDFDFTKTFTEQFGELMLRVPRYSLFSLQCENCDYGNHIGYSKDCYLCYSSVHSKNVMFSWGSIENTDCMDLSYVEKSQLCYECIKCYECYNVKFGFYSKGCSDCFYINNCEGCGFCYQCYDLNNKSYCINNIQLSKEEYFESIKGMKGGWDGLVLNSKIKAIHNIGCDNCIGNQLIGCKDVVLGDGLTDCEGCRYFWDDTNVKNSYDCYGSSNGNYCYELMAGPGNYNTAFSTFVSSSSDVFYSNLVHEGNSHIFGCIGLRNKSYCIFNKQYTKDEYEIMVGKIIRHMQSTGERGEFFHPSLSPFGYNETVAQEYYPMGIQNSKLKIKNVDSDFEEIDYEQFGYKRSDYSSDPKIPDGAKTIDYRLDIRKEDKSQRVDLNDSVLHGTDYDVCKQVFLCEVSGRPFMLQHAEIDFYRNMKLYLPRRHPDIRHKERMKLRPGRTLFLRTCDCCGKEILSVYPEEHKGKVYCDECYQKEVYA